MYKNVTDREIVHLYERFSDRLNNDKILFEYRQFILYDTLDMIKEIIKRGIKIC